MHLQAAWLGSWRAPWGLARGRRWGDPAWALATIAQAWLLGGKEGRWPRVTWSAKRPEGPRIGSVPEAFDRLPAPEWISLLRHGSPRIPAAQRGPGESELVAHCWTALLRGDGAPWMALGAVLFDRAIRTRWLPVLAAVDEAGALQLPPFLETLVPAGMRSLPPGWWICLLSRTDGSGRLLPEGPPPQELPWALLEPAARGELDPLLLREPPRVLTPAQRDQWATQVAGDSWMIDPRLRAWGRGQGIGPETLAELVPRSIALGDEPDGLQAEALADPKAPSLPPAAGLDGYPAAPTLVHPCADPFHWLRQARHADCPREALQAFLWAQAHFQRLHASAWVRRVAAEACRMALAWGDLPRAETWKAQRGMLESPHLELEEAEFAAARGDWDQAQLLAGRLASRFPRLSGPWVLLGQAALLLDLPGVMQEVISHLEPGSLRNVLRAALGEPDCVVDLDRHSALLWAFHRAWRDPAAISGFWSAWEDCRHALLRLETGIRLLERHSDCRSPARLLDLQRLADRSGANLFKIRVASLWPSADAVPEATPRRMVEEWLLQSPKPIWLVWGSRDRPDIQGTGPRPPDWVLGSLHEAGHLAPLEAEGIVWWGHALHWEGSPVGSVLHALEPDSPPQVRTDSNVIAPWLARLQPIPEPARLEPLRHLLTDGSEPMALVVAELVRVAPTELPVLILGPTGSGKELTAREIHDRSARKGPFRPINCSEYAESLLESELFGHTKGAFTGAERDRKGAIECAEGGTLFLDEVADLTPRLQSLFLRVLQEKEIRRVGSDRVHRVDVRFLAATHRSLDELVAGGLFRKDLYYRLKGVVLTLPSLKERRHELPSLLPELVARIAQESGLPLPALCPSLAAALARHPWPGNFRELRHAIENALLRRREGALKATHFPDLADPPVEERGWDDATRQFQRQLLLETLRQHRFQVTEAAHALGIARPALYLTARRLGLDLAAERARWQKVD